MATNIMASAATIVKGGFLEPGHPMPLGPLTGILKRESTKSISGSSDKRERDIIDGFDAIFTLNTRNLTQANIDVLRGMVIQPMGDDGDSAIFFSEAGLDANGTFSGWRTTDDNGLMQGFLSFQVPGLDEPTDGSWIAINRTAVDDTTEAAFDNAKMITGSYTEIADLKRVIEILEIIELQMEEAEMDL